MSISTLLLIQKYFLFVNAKGLTIHDPDNEKISEIVSLANTEAALNAVSSSRHSQQGEETKLHQGGVFEKSNILFLL